MFGTVFELYFALNEIKKNHNPKFARALYYEGRICDSLAFLERYREYENDKEYVQHVLADYPERIVQLLEMFPDFKLRLKVDSKTGKIIYGADVQSVFDISWYAFSRMVADVAPLADPDMRFEDYHGTVLSCLCCGNFFVRHSSRQLYCDNPNC
jgi:hypothetical protein